MFTCSVNLLLLGVGNSLQAEFFFFKDKPAERSELGKTHKLKKKTFKQK